MTDIDEGMEKFNDALKLAKRSEQAEKSLRDLYGNALIRIAELEARPWRSPDDWPYNGQEVEVILNATFTEPDENTWLPWRLDSFDMAQDSGDAIVSWRPRYE